MPHFGRARADRRSGTTACCGGSLDRCRSVGAPTAELRDLSLPFAENRVGKYAGHLIATCKADFAGAQSDRLLQQDGCKPLCRHLPDFHRHGHATGSNAQPFPDADPRWSRDERPAQVSLANEIQRPRQACLRSVPDRASGSVDSKQGLLIRCRTTSNGRGL